MDSAATTTNRRILSGVSLDDEEEEDMVEVALGGQTLAEIPVQQPFPEDEMTPVPADPPPDIENADTFMSLIEEVSHDDDDDDDDDSEEEEPNDEEPKACEAVGEVIVVEDDNALSESENENDYDTVQGDDDEQEEKEHDSEDELQEEEENNDTEAEEVEEPEETDEEDEEAVSPRAFFRNDDYDRSDDERSDPPGADAATAISSIGSVSARQSFLRKQERTLKEMSRELVRDKYNSRSRYTYGSDIETNMDNTSKCVIDEESTEVSDVVDEKQHQPPAAGFRGCSHPCGKYELAAVLLSFLAFVLCGVSTDRCDFLVVEGSEEAPGFFALAQRDVGLVQFETISPETSTSKCLYWFDDPDASAQLYDHVWHAARFMSVTATFLGLFFVGFICTISCVSYDAVIFQMLAFASLIMPLLYGLSFIVLGSNVCLEGSCEIGIGGLVLILGIIVWMMVAAVLYLIPGRRLLAGQKTQEASPASVETAKHHLYSGHLGVGILFVIFFVALVDISVILGRSPPAIEEETVAPTEAPSTEKVLDWLQEGELILGPFPDSRDYLSVAGNGRVISLIGKESVLVMEHDEAKRLWYPFGNMISANLDPTGWDPDDRITKVKATASSLSSNGRIVAVASNNWANGPADVGRYEFGRVQVWQHHQSSSRWIPKGHPITGKGINDAFATKVELDSLGTRLAVVATGQFGRNEPYVRIYEYNEVLEANGNWVQLGQDIRLESFWTSSGFAFSGDGKSFALGSLRIGRLGLVTVWHYESDKKMWIRLGSPITAGSSKREDKFGASVAMAYDGSALLVGDPGGSPAYARAFWFNGKGWKQLGQDLECNLDGRCANDVSMSYFGSMVAITGYHSFNQVARVYSLDGPQQKWVKVGGDIQGPKSEHSIEGTSVGISDDGRTVVFGTTFQDTQTQVWQYTGGLYIDVPLEGNLATGVPTQTPSGTNESTVQLVLDSSSNATVTYAPAAITPLPLGNLSLAEPVENATKAEAMTNSSSNSSAWVNTSLLELNDTESTGHPSESVPSSSLQPHAWIRAVAGEEYAFFLFDSVPPRIERYNLSSRQFLLPVLLPTSHGPPSAMGIDDSLQIYVGFGAQAYRFSFDGANETRIAADAGEIDSNIREFLFDDNDIVIINAGQHLISVNRRTNNMVKNVFSYNELVLGASLSSRRRRLFGRTPVELAPVSGDVIRPSELWFKEYDAQGRFVSEKLSEIGENVDVGTASKTWIFPDQTRVIDDHGFVFSVTNNAEHVYTVDTPKILDIAWLGGEVMVALHKNGSLSSISQELVSRGSLTLDFAPSNIAVNNGEVLTFTYDLVADNGIRVDAHYLGLLNPSLPGRHIQPSGIPFTPASPFVDKDSLLYMFSKGHASIFVMEPKEKSYLDSIKLEEIPKFIAYSSINHEVYLLREDGVLSKIDLGGQNRTEVHIAKLPAAPFGLSTAGKYIFVCDDAGAFATHYTFLSNGTVVSAVDWNHVDKEYVWSEVNRKMYFFRQANPTDLMTEHIFFNGTIGIRVDSYLNNNSGFEHPIRVDPAGHRAVLGSGVVHNARTLKRLNVTLSNRVLDIAFSKGVARSIRNLGKDKVQLQQWHERTFQLLNATELSGRGHHLFALDENKTVAVVSNETGVPMAYVLDEHFRLS
ncbi:expressed unknown protein [Seminavis robusta]|uniref:Uncharacterized protein n=1 Tax=Seminavis robusta TaxID=568900 RepID=A0A9N8HPY4_9STRA|nr:expressed unknown protein [Seminavis robusta]|eukprot:Sro1377_g267550.1 n/a (1637) ;mRNA; f:13650-18560